MGKMGAEATATLRFRMRLRDGSIDVEKRTYRILLRAAPKWRLTRRGVNVPLFGRDHYLANCTRWRTVERFVADRTVR